LTRGLSVIGGAFNQNFEGYRGLPAGWLD
jgi:hypothetical protein